jgi:hypothetical protein
MLARNDWGWIIGHLRSTPLKIAVDGRANLEGPLKLAMKVAKGLVDPVLRFAVFRILVQAATFRPGFVTSSQSLLLLSVNARR